MTQFFANAAASHFAQAACAAFSCSDMNSMIILDASLILLASIIISRLISIIGISLLVLVLLVVLMGVPGMKRNC